MAEMAREKQRLIAEATAAANEEFNKAEEAARIKRETREAEEKRIFNIEEAKKKEKRDVIQALKDKGQWMTKKELAKKKAQDLKRAELIAQGIVFDDEDDEDDKPKKKSQVVKRSKGKKPEHVQKNEDQEAKDEKEEDEQIDSSKPEEKKVKVEKETVGVKKEDSEEDAVDDWENADLDEIAGKIKLNKDISVAVPDDEDNQQILESKEIKENKN